MKSSLSMLRRISFPKSVAERRRTGSPSRCPMRLLRLPSSSCYLCVQNSESLWEIGACLLEKTPVNDDEENGEALEMLGRVQIELQKLIDSFRSHIIVTIINPSESLLNELRTVEDMRRQCDEKGDVYEYMISQLKEKGRSKGGEGEDITSQKLQSAYDEYREEATLCAFRLESLKQGIAGPVPKLTNTSSSTPCSSVEYLSEGT